MRKKERKKERKKAKKKEGNNNNKGTKRNRWLGLGWLVVLFGWKRKISRSDREHQLERKEEEKKTANEWVPLIIILPEDSCRS